jgi:pilus assembly protein Flp/PilA
VAAIVHDRTSTQSKGRKMKNFLISLWKEEDGQDLVEYGLLVALVALAATVGMKGLATAINTTFANLGTALTSAATTTST